MAIFCFFIFLTHLQCDSDYITRHNNKIKVFLSAEFVTLQVKQYQVMNMVSSEQRCLVVIFGVLACHEVHFPDLDLDLDLAPACLEGFEVVSSFRGNAGNVELMKCCVGSFWMLMSH